MSKVDNAIGYFNQNLNCAQAVLTAYCEDLGLDKDTAQKLACGFGAGMGRLQETCGAVTGAYMVLSLKYGTDKEITYKKIREFSQKFKERNKTTNCKELLNIDMVTGDKIIAKERVRLICPKMVKDAAEILEEL